MQSYDYRFQGDRLFEMVPDWYQQKVAGRGPIIADLARLLWIEQILESEAFDTVIWLDADTLIFMREQLTADVRESCVFGKEHWLQLDSKGKTRTYKNVHNAYCAFRKGCPILKFLIYTIQRMVARVAADAIAPQFVGPKLLSSLHNIVGFQTDDRFGAISPRLAQLLLTPGANTKQILATQSPNGLCAANLCLSLHTEIDHQNLVNTLRRQ